MTADAQALPTITAAARNELRWARSALMLLSVTLLFVWSISESYLLYHTLVELITICIAFLLGVVAWYTFPLSRNAFLAFLGIAFPGVAVIDLWHTLAFKGMNIFAAPGANMPTQLWIAARYFEAVVLLLAPLYLVRPLNLRAAAAGVALTTLALSAWVASGYFPTAYVDGVGLTPFKINSEYIIVLLLLLAGLHLWRRRDAVDPPMLRLIMAALACTVVSELAFTFYVGVYDLSNLVGHLFKLAAFWLIFRAIIARGLQHPFHLLSSEVSTYDAILQPVVVVDRDGRVRQTNRAAGAGTIGADCHAVYHPRELTRSDCPLCQRIARGESADQLEIYFAESKRWQSVTLTPLSWGGSVGAMVQVSNDITGRKEGELELCAVNRALTTISASNHALVHAADEEQLLNALCDTVVEAGGYRFVWVGFVAQEEGGAIRPVRSAGDGAGYLDEVRFPCGDGSDPSPVCLAARTGHPAVANDIGAGAPAPWREAALRRDFGSMLAFPLKSGDRPVLGVLALYATRVNAFTDKEIALLAELAGDLGYGLEALRAAAQRNRAEARAADFQARLERSLRQAVAALATTIEKRDPYTAGHQRRVADLAAAIARGLDLPEEEVAGVAMGGLVHDVGKIYVPAEILNRPGKLSAVEYEVVRSHASVGEEIIGGIDFPWPVAEMVLSHHERLDGSGYPRGLKGDEIGLAARILAVADVVEAMSSHRPYRPALGTDAALQEVRDHAGTWYDARVVEVCERLFREEGYRFPS